MVLSLFLGTRRVLMVEDDPTPLFLMMEMVELEGIRALGAADAEKAAVVFQVYKDIAALMTDVEMSGLVNGIELAHFVQCQWPRIRIFITSGRKQRSPAPMPIGSTFARRPSELARYLRNHRAGPQHFLGDQPLRLARPAAPPLYPTQNFNSRLPALRSHASPQTFARRGGFRRMPTMFMTWRRISPPGCGVRRRVVCGLAQCN